MGETDRPQEPGSPEDDLLADLATELAARRRRRARTVRRTFRAHHPTPVETSSDEFRRRERAIDRELAGQGIVAGRELIALNVDADRHARRQRYDPLAGEELFGSAGGGWLPSGAEPPFQWLLAAIASGVIGNLAYDALKQSLAAVVRRRRSAGERRTELDEATGTVADFVRAVVEAQCSRHGLPCPDLPSLTVSGWEERELGLFCVVESADDRFRADVLVPYDLRPDRRPVVRINGPASPVVREAIDRAVEQRLPVDDPSGRNLVRWAGRAAPADQPDRNRQELADLVPHEPTRPGARFEGYHERAQRELLARDALPPGFLAWMTDRVHREALDASLERLLLDLRDRG